jgi:quinol monooxygenase YgiN
MHVIFEVNLTFQKNIEKDFHAWLTGHIDDVLEIEGFISADWFETNSLPSSENHETSTWTVQYRMKNQAALDHYLENHAARLRQPAIDQFGTKFQAVRRVLKPIKSY